MLNSKRFTGTRVRHLVHLTALCLCLSGSLTNLVQAQSATDLALLKSTAPDRAAKLALKQKHKATERARCRTGVTVKRLEFSML
jgi:hypothetical protein